MIWGENCNRDEDSANKLEGRSCCSASRLKKVCQQKRGPLTQKQPSGSALWKSALTSTWAVSLQRWRPKSECSGIKRKWKEKNWSNHKNIFLGILPEKGKIRNSNLKSKKGENCVHFFLVQRYNCIFVCYWERASSERKRLHLLYSLLLLRK